MIRASLFGQAVLVATLAAMGSIQAGAASPLSKPSPSTQFLTAPMTVQAGPETMRPAPLPDPDVQDPAARQDARSAQGDASLTPGIFNMRSHFAGDGYAPGSSLETDQNHRQTVGGGMNLQVPMP